MSRNDTGNLLIHMSPSQPSSDHDMNMMQYNEMIRNLKQESSPQGSSPPVHSPDWNSVQTFRSSTTPPTSKQHHKTVKKLKSENSDGGDDDIPLEPYLHMEVHRIPVKILRKIVPKLRIATYYSDLQVGGKKKLKHLWDEKPSDWPDNVPFKDPNNSGKDRVGKSHGTMNSDADRNSSEVKKPGKEELGPMFNFLIQRYKRERQGQYSTPVMAESSPNDSSYFYTSVSENAQLMPSQHKTEYSNDVNVSYPTYCGQYMNYPTFQLGSNPMQHQPMTVTYQPVTLPPSAVPERVNELHDRLIKKMNEIMNQFGFPVVEIGNILTQVHREVISFYYEKIQANPSDKQACLVFIDAGHQLEALLDVMFVLDQVDVDLMNRGCQEIVKKFTQEMVQCAMLPTISMDTPMLSKKENYLSEGIENCLSGYKEYEKPGEGYYEGKIFGEDLVEFLDQSDQLNRDINDLSQMFKLRTGAEEILDRQVIEKRTINAVLTVDCKLPSRKAANFELLERTTDYEMEDDIISAEDVEKLEKFILSCGGSEQFDSLIESTVNIFQKSMSVQSSNQIAEVQDDVNLTVMCQNMDTEMEDDLKNWVTTGNFNQDGLEPTGVVASQESTMQHELSQLVPSNSNIQMIPAHVAEASYNEFENDDFVNLPVLSSKPPRHRGANKDGGRTSKCLDRGGQIW